MRRFFLLVILFIPAVSGLTQENSFYKQLADSAVTLTENFVIYDPAYRTISYPNGDVAKNRGVCTDVIIRAYRKMGIDLQKLVHEDMKANFSIYPSQKMWGLKTTDKNIDHRRVPNLQTFFSRKGQSLPVSKNALNYRAGDIVSWDLGGGVTHIGIVAAKKSKDGKRPLIVHNIGRGQVLEDCLFDWKITGHYRYK